MEYFKRDLESEIAAQISSGGDQVILLSGARQTGKTTLITNLLPSAPKLIINLWDEEREVVALRSAGTFSEFEQVLKSVFNFRPDGSRMLVIDEAQASVHLSSFIMEMHRKWQGQRVILLGSLMANLYAQGRPIPVGRTIEFVCRPLNFREFLRFRKKEEYLDLVRNEGYGTTTHDLLLAEYRVFLQIGGLPGMVRADTAGQSLSILFESFLNNIYRDADRFINQSGHTGGRIPQYGRILESVMTAIARHTGFPTQNATLLSTDSPAYRSVLPHVLEALWAWHLAYLVTFQTAQQTSRQGYSSKKYLFDTGVANYLLSKLLPVGFGDGDERAAMLLENGVLQDCISRATGIRSINCYRSNNKSPTELDFVAVVNGNTFGIEVKSSGSVKRQTIHQLHDFLKRGDYPEGFVVYTGMPRTEIIENRRIHFIPPYKVLDVLSETINTRD